MNPIALGSRWLAYAENKVRQGPCWNICDGASVSVPKVTTNQQ